MLAGSWLTLKDMRQKFALNNLPMWVDEIGEDIVYAGTRIANSQNLPDTLAPGNFSVCLD
jgi:hypothetical protein